MKPDEHRVARALALHLAGGLDLDLFEARVDEQRGELLATEAVVVDALDVGRVEAAVLAVEVGEGDPSARHQVGEQGPEQRAGVLHVVHGHRADDEVNLAVEGPLDEVLTNNINAVAQLGSLTQLLEHRR